MGQSSKVNSTSNHLIISLALITCWQLFAEFLTFYGFKPIFEKTDPTQKQFDYAFIRQIILVLNWPFKAKMGQGNDNNVDFKAEMSYFLPLSLFEMRWVKALQKC